MHRLVLGAFSLSPEYVINKMYPSLNAPFGARCFLTGSAVKTKEEKAKMS